MTTLLPTPDELTELLEKREVMSVSIYLPSTPQPSGLEAVKLALKNATSAVVAELTQRGAPTPGVTALRDHYRALLADEDAFWERQAHGIAVLASPTGMHAYRLPFAPVESTSIDDRFDVGPLLKAASESHSCAVLILTEGDVRLLELEDDTVREVPLDLPDDLAGVLHHATTPDHADNPRADGANGQKPEQQRYCRIVQDAVLAALADDRKPLILAASHDLEPAYRAINSHPRLLPHGVGAHPDSLSRTELTERATSLCEEDRAARLAEWRESFGSKKSARRASSTPKELRKAADAGAIDALLFDITATRGEISDLIVRARETGATVRGVTRDELPDESPVAATLRFPVDF